MWKSQPAATLAASTLAASGVLFSFSLPSLAVAQTAASHTVDSVIVTGRRDPEDPPVVGEARQRLA